MASNHERAISIFIILVLSAGAGLIASTNCDGNSEPEAQTNLVANLLQPAVLKEWAHLKKEIAIDTSSASVMPEYSLGQNCLLIYDFSLHWPLRTDLANETVGRFQLQPHPEESPGRIMINNRATGTYPVHQEVHHPGHQWWYDDIEPIAARLGTNGLEPETRWPGEWMAPRPPLGLAAFFPALAIGDTGTGSWSLHSGPTDTTDDGVLFLETKSARSVLVDDEEAVIIDAATGGDDDPNAFFGRYLISERGRILAAVWAAPAGDDELAIATIRLTGSCDGIALPPIPRNDDMAPMTTTELEQ